MIPSRAARAEPCPEEDHRGEKPLGTVSLRRSYLGARAEPRPTVDHGENAVGPTAV